ncbi:unnamed protein product [Prunus armeniaca]|uniref:Uncharacterized protein n=1 Tax=Prunus armeniaca TaxID=36596 RepID=A0A6J5X8S9_PRUAR|nr:unnamed protein product [Prunus armeniaca]
MAKANITGHVDWIHVEAAARFLGVASSALATAEYALISELIASVSGRHKLRFEAQHGALCAVGYVTADCRSRNLLETAALASVAIQALGHIGLIVPLPSRIMIRIQVEDVLFAAGEALSFLWGGVPEAFSHLLGEQNELTQELASQGMSIVYELGDASMKENWVHALVNSLTGSGKRKRAIKLVEDSECFKRELLVKVLVEGNSARIRSFANVANEMGQPDLIYKFMDLANYQASLIPRGVLPLDFQR